MNPKFQRNMFKVLKISIDGATSGFDFLGLGDSAKFMKESSWLHHIRRALEVGRLTYLR